MPSMAFGEKDVAAAQMPKTGTFTAGDAFAKIMRRFAR
jgi:hypothetical protein